jgi:hypothetical protein
MPHAGTAISAADTDGDGIDEIALATTGESVLVYATDGQGGLNRIFSGPVGDNEATVAFEGDGEQCFAVGESGTPVVLYGDHHQNGYDVEASTASNYAATAVAWGDVDGDGARELVVGTDNGPLHLFAHERYGNGPSDLTEIWTSGISDPTRAVAFGDLDGDGDPDLAVGNDGAPDRIYTDDNGTLSLQWSADGDARTAGVAWGSWMGGPDPCEW